MILLSLNGGGTLGYISVGLLAKIERELTFPLYQAFDMVTGVSTGSIIAGMLAMGVPTSEMKRFYLQDGPKLFSNKRTWMFWKPWYDRARLDETVRDTFCKTTFGSSLRLRLMTYATKTSGDIITSTHWKSWDPANQDILLSDAILASCSAPIYFSPYTFGGSSYADGGLSANNPSMCAICEAVTLGANLDSIYNLNINSGKTAGFDNAKKMKTVFDWLPKITQTCISAGVRSVEYEAHSLIGFRNHVIEPLLGLSIDTLEFDKMDKEVDRLWEMHKIELLTNLNV